jgi:hypothetical protein
MPGSGYTQSTDEAQRRSSASLCSINLENAVGREKDVQAIDLDSVMKKCVVTLLVISTFFI